jgi:RNA ligase (TIGR02306 family)
MRKLATIQQIRKLVPIPGADRIELAMVNDWTCIVKKGEFEVNDLCVYFEIDSLLPEDSRYEFLASSKKDYFGKPKYRIKTMKMRGVISQGLALPLGMYLELRHNSLGDDVSEALGVIKYDPGFYTDNGQKPRTGNTKGKFPHYLRKTDQDRIQSLGHYYELHKDHEFECTLKADGSSLTAGKVSKQLNLFNKIKRFFRLPVKDYHFCVCSRNLELKRTDSYSATFINGQKTSEYNQSDFWKVAIELDIEKHLPVGFAISGELVGPKIQSNHEKVDKLELWVFDVFDIKEQHYLLPEERREFMATYLSHVEHVPIVHESIKIFTQCKDINSLQEFVTGRSKNGGISEGMVFKSTTVRDLSFKCISNEYLLKCEE